MPEPDPKMHILAQGLVARGHEVTVLTAFPNYPHGRVYDGYRQRPWTRETLDGVRIVRLPLFADHSRSAWRRALHYATFALSASLLGPFLSGPADVVLVYHPPTSLGLPAWLLKRLRRAPFVYEIQDLWPETLEATGLGARPSVMRAVDRVGRWTYRHAAALTVISPGFKANVVAKGVPADKVHVLPNWAYEGEIPALPRDEALAAELGLASRFNVFYGGNMGPAQGLGNVVEAAALLQDLPDVQFVLMGDGIDRPRLEEAVRAKGLRNVRLLPRRPMSDMPRIYPLVDAVMVHLVDDPLFRITIPGKTQSCLASGRPVVAVVAGDAADLVRDSGAGVAVPPSDPRGLAEAVRRLRAMRAEEREALGAAGRAYYETRLRPEVMIDRYEKLLASVARAR